MSLPTPPGTSHRERRVPRVGRVSWSETAEYHSITASPPRTPTASSRSSRVDPSRSILKKTSILPPLKDQHVKETTPEPEDPLADLHYLDHPIAQLIAPDASLRDLIQAHSILTARLRDSVAGNAEADASWPLFQPLRKHRIALVHAVVRDLSQVFVDPLEGCQDDVDVPSSPREPPSTSTLPSPRDSPKKQKRGMSAEQVKRARDLCGVCHAALRLLSVIFTQPAIYSLFHEEELGYMLTHVLAITLAKELPTPNARKTWALVIWLIQVQRLPLDILEPAKDRITYALRRGINGELGKEGKKGSTGDGLKAVHDLALYQPALFVPAFVPLLHSILAQLLAPTLLLRSQACHALGGLAMAAASLPPMEVHTRAATMITSRLLKRTDTSPLTPTKRRVDTSPSKDSTLVRTLRTTLQVPDPKHSAQGPVWAFSVIAHLVVLLGPTVYLHTELTRTILALFTLGMRHPKSSIRALGCLAWRAMTWAFFRPPHVKLTIDAETDGDDESATEEDCIAERRRHDDTMRECLQYLPTMVDMGAGIGTIGALLGQEVLEDSYVVAALRVLRNMSKKGGQTCKDAMELTRHLLSAASPSHDMMVEKEWNHRKLLVPGFFSATPGLLTVEWRLLSSAVKPLLEECPQIQDVRVLTLDEIASNGIWEEFLSIWRDGLTLLKLSVGHTEIPSEIREIWHNLLKCHVAPLVENDDHDGLGALATNVRHVLVGLLRDQNLDFTLRDNDILDDQVPTSPVKPMSSRHGKGEDNEPLPESRWNYVVKLFIVRDLFAIAGSVFPEEVQTDLAESLLRYLNGHEETVVGDVQCADEVRSQWASFCAETVFACDCSVMQAFWSNELRKGRRGSEWNAGVRAAVWHEFVHHWKSEEAEQRSWEAAIILLSVPFLESSCWELASQDIDAWDSLLRMAIDAALDHGIDATTLVDHIASTVARNHSPSETISVRVADLLLSNVEIADARQAPTEVIEFANDTLNSAYPPAPRHKVMCMWLIRSLTRAIDACPSELCLPVLELLTDGLRTWLTDDFLICSEEEYSSDILPLYQTLLVSMQSLPRTDDVLETLAPILVAPFCGRKDRHVGTVDAFAEFWQATYAERPEPSSGYPEYILQCLDAVAQARLEEEEDIAQVEDMTALDAQPPSPILVDALETIAVPADAQLEEQVDVESEDEGSIVIPSPGTLARLSIAAIFSPPSSPKSNLLPVPSTPKSSPDHTTVHTTPKRPHKSAIKDLAVTDLATVSTPRSFEVESTPIRAPTTPKRSPAKAYARDKENMSPLSIASVTQRLAMRSPLLLESILGKRPRNDDAEDVAALNESALKKGRRETSPATTSVFSSVRVNAVMHDSSNTLEPPPSSAPIPEELTKATGESDKASTSPESESEGSTVEDAQPVRIFRKRKGMFLDAVEVPSLATVMRARRRRLDSQEADPSTITDSDHDPGSTEAFGPTLRRTRSATKLLGVEAEFHKLDNSPKRRRMNRTAQLREKALEMSSLQSLGDVSLFNSDDSIMVDSPIEMPEMPPSDDDPYIGQVTPHRLVSPALRRVQRIMFDFDPPSDDSNMSNSPSRDRVIRKMARLGSERLTPMKLTPLGVRSGVRSRSITVASSSSALGSER